MLPRILAPLVLLPFWAASALDVFNNSQLWTALSSVNESSIVIHGYVQLAPQQVPIAIKRTLTISGGSPGATLDFVTPDAPALQLQGVRLSFANLTLARPLLRGGQALPVELGPIPAVNVSGGELWFGPGVVLHVEQGMDQLVQASDWWRRNNASLFLGSSGALVMPSQPQAPNSGSTYISSLLTLLLEPSASCYTGGSAAYDSASLQALMGDSSVSRVYMLSPIAMQPSFTYLDPLSIQRPLEVYSCRERQLDVNYNWTMLAIRVVGASLTLRNMTIKNVKAINRIFTPNVLVPLISPIRLIPPGASAHLVDVTITTPDKGNVTAGLVDAAALTAAQKLNITVPPNDDTMVVINSWQLHLDEWVCVAPALKTQPGLPYDPTTVWTWSNVTVKHEAGSACGKGGVKVHTGTELRQLIEDPLIPAVEIIQDIAWNKDEWPAEASGPSPWFPGIILMNKTFSISACHPTPGQRYTVDFGDLGQVVFVFGSMHWRGDMRMVNPHASPRRNWLYLLIGALSVETDGVISFKDVEIFGNNPSPFHNNDDTFWNTASDCGSLCPYFLPDRRCFINGSYYDALVINYRFFKTPWVLYSQKRNVTGTGFWDYENILMRWYKTSQPALPPSQYCIDHGFINGSSTDGRDDSEGVPPAAIAVPVAVGGALVITAAVLALVLLRRRARAAKGAGSVGGDGDQSDNIMQQIQQGTLEAEVHSKGMSTKDGIEVVMGSTGGSSGNPKGAATGTGGGTGGGSGGGKGTVLVTVGEAGAAGSESMRSKATEVQIEAIRRNLSNAVPGAATRSDQIELVELLGEGTFGRVYKGMWRGTQVAVKTMVFPATMSGREKREKMAIMETAISASLSHPNVVQTYTYAVRAVDTVPGAAPEQGPGASISLTQSQEFMESKDTSIGSWEVRLVIEYCDRGSLRDALNHGHFVTPEGRVNMLWVVETALEVGRAMLHLHSENIIHSDLKARNILLKSGYSPTGRPFTAKVADFGLSLRIDPGDTHVSNMFQGTMTHMAPEVLMQGKVSRASDVYAFGILLWELYTGGHAFKGVPRALLGHEITKGNKRPEFPSDCLFEYQLLACRCWESDFAIRPGFAQVLDDLVRMYARLCADTRPALAGGAGSQVHSSGGSQAGAAGGVGGEPRGGAALPVDTYDSVAGMDPKEAGAAPGQERLPMLGTGAPTTGTSSEMGFITSSAMRMGPVEGSSMWGQQHPGGAYPVSGAGSGPGGMTASVMTGGTDGTGVHRIAPPPGHAYTVAPYVDSGEDGAYDQSMTDSVLLPPYMRRYGMPAIAENPSAHGAAEHQAPAGQPLEGSASVAQQ